ncbi:MAG: hypothetical protein U0Q18_18965 [Bryobacteraceae bacterium]
MNGLAQGLRQLVAFGTGAGIQVNEDDLEVAVARVRPTGVDVLGRMTIARFRERPAAQWGADYGRFVKDLGADGVTATVLLPRHECIVRQISMRGVAAKEMDTAVAYQLDALNPYGDEEVLLGWSALGDGAVLVGIARRATVERYLELFSEAGIKCGSFTFAAAAIRAAIRLGPPPPAAFLALGQTANGTVETYGESPSRAVFSAEFDLPREKAAALAASELRLDPETVPLNLEDLLPKPRVNPVDNDLARNPLPYAVALAGACPRLETAANLIPVEQRAISSRAYWIPLGICATLFVLAVGSLFAWPGLDHRRYLKELNAQIAQLEPEARRATALDKQIEHTRARLQLLQQFKSRTRSDLDAINELTRILPPPTWTNMVELSRDSAVINGEAEQAAPLLKAVDASPLFQNSEFSGISKVGASELFRLRTQRKGTK